MEKMVGHCFILIFIIEIRPSYLLFIHFALLIGETKRTHSTVIEARHYLIIHFI